MGASSPDPDLQGPPRITAFDWAHVRARTVADHKYAFPLVLDRTKEYLKNVFGMELVPVKYSISRKGTSTAPPHKRRRSPTARL